MMSTVMFAKFAGRHSKSKKDGDSKGSAKKTKVKKPKKAKELGGKSDADDEHKSAAESDEEGAKSEDVESPKVCLADNPNMTLGIAVPIQMLYLLNFSDCILLKSFGKR